MNAWLTALTDLHAAATPCVLVTVAEVQGSTPRAAGARMVYSAEDQFDTIGGGHLEWRAAQIARAMLTDQASAPVRLERIALGPSLGQCCGGVVFLTFERINTAGRSGVMLAQQEQYRRQYMDLWRAQPQVVLFGAGHVGSALIALLRTLPCRVIWVDEREHMFPTDLPPQISVEATDVPNAVVDLADPGAYFIVMTHSHALDQQLTERILRRDDVGWFGLIGSYTKRKQFEHRLQDRGITTEQLQKMTCPIGIPGIYGKEPASIAIAVVAQLVQLWELQAQRASKPAALSFMHAPKA